MTKQNHHVIEQQQHSVLGYPNLNQLKPIFRPKNGFFGVFWGLIRASAMSWPAFVCRGGRPDGLKSLVFRSLTSE
jgi:hypothetical protein